MVVVYEFWRYDLPTELVRELLYDLGIPYREKVIRLKRKSLEDQPYDEWTRIHVDPRELVDWLRKRIDKELKEYVDSVQDKRTKHVIETLEKQYKTEKYGKLHRTLFKHGIRTELYIGDGIEMYYPYFYNQF